MAEEGAEKYPPCPKCGSRTNPLAGDEDRQRWECTKFGCFHQFETGPRRRRYREGLEASPPPPPYAGSADLQLARCRRRVA